MLAEIRSEVTDAEGKPVVTSVVTMLGEAAHHEADADATVAAIASI
ncbi:MaoC-like dehydratase [Mycobacterium tuberculosis]|uniref:MaoC-like dehydratase n=1 Tax=Mycobacterium tuberculosis TaxID=1773 RepID=A0A654U0R1_MYCTX|nr:MaoC-like dehydratase [Mycobacterium tuberculosis]CKU09082.1 MaoC-like dehydratase [Mycobacterium tuberculosis]